VTARSIGGAGLCWSSSGALIAARVRGGAVLLDVRRGRHHAVPVERAEPFAFVRDQLLVVQDTLLRTVTLAAELGLASTPLPPGRRASFCASTWSAQLVVSSPTRHGIGVDGNWQVERIDDTDQLVAVLPGRTVVLARGRRVVIVDPADRALHVELPGELASVDVLLGGRGLAIRSVDREQTWCDVVSRTGELLRRFELPPLVGWAVAGARGLAIGLDASGRILGLDVRERRVMWVRAVDADWAAIGLDPQGVTLAVSRQGSGELELIPVARIAGPGAVPAVRADGSDAAPGPEPAAAADAANTGAQPRGASVPGATSARPAEPHRAPPAIALARLPAALPAWLARPARREYEVVGVAPYASAAEHLDAMLALCRARAHLAVVREWSLGRLAFRRDERHPFEAEVATLARGAPTPTGPECEVVERRCATLYGELVCRTGATLAAGARLPMIELAAEYGLSPLEVHIVATLAAAQLNADIARLHAILANNTARSVNDRALVRTVLGAQLDDTRAARVLGTHAPLLRFGLVEARPAASWLFDPLVVRPSLLLRLLGEPPAIVAGEHVIVRDGAALELESFRGPRDALARWLAALADIPAARREVRLAVQGPAGTGRRTLVDGFAARAGRRCGFIESARLASLGTQVLGALRDALRDAAIAGLLPCVVDPQDLAADPAARHAVGEVLRAHPGPLAAVTRIGAETLLGAACVTLALPPATTTERLAMWTETADRFGLVAHDLISVATRLPAGPAVIERVCRATALATAGQVEDCTAALDEACRQQLESHVGKLATRVQRKPRRDELIMPADLLETIDELTARVRLRPVVYDQWGFGQRLTSLRGLTALFYGPPGTGKTMAAGVIARELDLELYRVDVSAVTSKWLGETEKHLAELFDAAEGGEIVLLFDEADSLFAKRTEVKSSNDRYANLETNYLLQRLDGFEGIAILTTNFDSSIDDAFMRRLAFRVQFPFPDIETRTRLWAAQLPAETPRGPDLDFTHLAERFELSGGKIRNCMLRAGFLAAREGGLLDQARVMRAIELEYHEMGRFSTAGRLA
jgi:hypothetical protein